MSVLWLTRSIALARKYSASRDKEPPTSISHPKARTHLTYSRPHLIRYLSESSRRSPMPQISVEDVIAQSLDGGGLDWNCLENISNHCDNDADLVLTTLQNRPINACASLSPPGQDDLLDKLRAGAQIDPALRRFWSNLHTIPEWVDWAQLERGRRVPPLHSGIHHGIRSARLCG